MAGERIAGRYRLLEPLGRGAMSSVWLAEDEELGRRVAVKTLAPTADRARFEREARAVASLSHPNICGLYDYGEAEGRPYMVLEYLPGGTLEDRLRGGRPLPDEEAELIAGEVASGLAHAHERGLVHRDLKPANILFDVEGRAKIADFGIARMGADGLTETGTVLGTAAYISPEQAAGEPAGPPSDVYSFGAILFRMLTGALPFAADNAMELVRMHRDEPPPTVASLRPDAPPRLAALADASLVKDPESRPHDGGELLAALAAAAPLVVPAAAPAEEETRVLRRTPPPAGPPRRHRRVVPAVAVAALVAALAAAGGVAAWLVTRPDGPSTGRPPATSSVSLPTVTATATGQTVLPPLSTEATSTAPPASTYVPPSTTPETTTHATTAAARTSTEVTSTAETSTAETSTAPATTAVTVPSTTLATTTYATTTYAPPTTTSVPPTTTIQTTTSSTTIVPYPPSTTTTAP